MLLKLLILFEVCGLVSAANFILDVTRSFLSFLSVVIREDDLEVFCSHHRLKFEGSSSGEK